MTTRPKKTAAPPASPPPALGKLDAMVAALRDEAGATIAQLMEATGWQQHSVRGAMAGALKNKGHTVTSAKADGVRVYRIAPVEEVSA